MPAQSQQLAVEMKLTYPVVSDMYKNIIRQYGVLHPTEQIARPAAFIIDRQGKMRWSYMGVDASDRPTIDTILRELRALK